MGKIFIFWQFIMINGASVIRHLWEYQLKRIQGDLERCDENASITLLMIHRSKLKTFILYANERPKTSISWNVN